MSKIKVFCFPFAGGSARTFFTWKNAEAKNIEVVPVELPGRGSRSHEPLLHQMSSVVEDCVRIVHNELSKQQHFMLFGHSMGCIIAYEVARILQTRYAMSPDHLFLSGRAAPQFPPETIRHTLPNKAFLKSIYELGGTDELLLNNQEFQDYFLPILRADFEMVETFSIDREVNRTLLHVGATLLNGTDDLIRDEQLQGWQEHFTDKVNVKFFAGGHFYLLDRWKEIIREIDGIAELITHH